MMGGVGGIEVGLIGGGRIAVGLGVDTKAVGAGDPVLEKVGSGLMGVTGTGVLGTEIVPVDMGTGVSKEDARVPTRIAISASLTLLSRMTSSIMSRPMAGIL